MTLFNNMSTALSPAYINLAWKRGPEKSGAMFSVRFVECLKFLSIVSLTKGRRIPVTPEVDDIWHELIVQTMSYNDLCQDLPGGHFIHHESITPAKYAERVGDYEFVRELLLWIPDYYHSFGLFTEEAAECWTVCDFLMSEMNMTLDDINALGASESPAASIPETSPWRGLADKHVQREVLRTLEAKPND